MKNKDTVRGIPRDKVLADLERYRKFLLDKGALEVTIAPPSKVIQTMRAAQCALTNVCYGSGVCYFCPPEFPANIRIARAIANEYEYVFIIRNPRALEGLMGPDPLGQLRGEVDLLGKDWPPDIKKYWYDFADKNLSSWRHSTATYELEKIARQDGYHFAFATRGGACVQKECQPFKSECLMRTSQFCRFPAEVRPDGAAGMYTDFLRIVEPFGYQQPVGGWCTTLAEEIPEKFRQTYAWGLFFIV